ncbi:MAG: hypothetical protein ACLP7Q_18390 [Isosphaeraceae bacterium]
MVSASNGRQDGDGGRRHRLDDFTCSTAATLSPCASRLPSYSGRLLVLGAGVVILILWGSLYLVFRDWRARYQARAAFGATRVAPVIDSLAQIVPQGMDAETWRRAVQQTHDMLVTVTSANLLDLEQMKVLRDELRQAVARANAHPETSRDELAGVWNAMADRAEFVLQEGNSGRRKSHPRPATLPPRPSKEAVAKTGKS